MTAADDQVGDEPRPAGLMRGAEPCTGIAMEVLMEGDEPVPGRVLLEQAVAAEHGSRAVRAPAEDADQPARGLVGNRPKIDRVAASGWALHLERIAEVTVYTRSNSMSR